MRDFTGKRYWILGADMPLGAALAAQLSRAGVELVLSGADQGALEDLMVALPGRAGYIPIDITQADPQGAVGIELGVIDGLVYAVDVAPDTSARSWSGSGAADCLQHNLVGIAHALDIALPLLRTRGEGHVVLCDSLAGIAGTPATGAYAAAKAGVRVLAESLHADPELRGISVQLVTLGLPAGALKTKPGRAAAGIFEHMGTSRFRRTVPAGAGGLFRLLNLLPSWAGQRLIAMLAKRAQD